MPVFGTLLGKWFPMIPEQLTEKLEHQKVWNQLAETFRQACLYRRQKRRQEATEILEKRLPPLIAHWSRIAPIEEGEKRRRLEEFFATEQRRIEDAWLIQNILLGQMRDVLIPSLCLQVTEEVRDLIDVRMKETMAGALETATNRLQENSTRLAEQQSRTMANTLCELTTVPATQSRPEEVPAFGDLPAIIDRMIDEELAQSALVHGGHVIV